MNKNVPESLYLKVATPNRLLIEADVEQVSLPSLDGYLGILPGHRPLLVELGKGDLTFWIAKKEERISLQGGYAEILPDKVLVLAELRKHEEDQSVEK